MKKILALILSAACVLTMTTCGGSSNNLLLASPSYPELVPYPDEAEYADSNGKLDYEAYDEAYDAWLNGRRAQFSQPEGYTEALEDYLRASIPQLLSVESGENRVCSPVNVYMSLAILAETTDGGSRAQLLELLGSESLESLRAEAAAVWNGNYCDDGALTSVLANSIWLSDSVKYNSRTVDSLADNYYASVFRGKMGSDGLNAALQGWVSEQTGGLLSEQAGGLKTDEDTLLALCSTIYFRDKWYGGFSRTLTAPQTFHAPGGDVERDFMHSGGERTYYRSDRFSACAEYLDNSGSMWFLLPNEGVTPEELIADGKTIEFIISRSQSGAESKDMIVNLAVPRFDVSSDLELSESLKALGVTDVFDYTLSDFSPLTKDTDQVFLSEARHAARVAIDEEGVTATAYTAVLWAAADIGPPMDVVDLVLDRPFVFAITSHDGLPLFVGIVNNP